MFESTKFARLSTQAPSLEEALHVDIAAGPAEPKSASPTVVRKRHPEVPRC